MTYDSTLELYDDVFAMQMAAIYKELAVPKTLYEQNNESFDINKISEESKKTETV